MVRSDLVEYAYPVKIIRQLPYLVHQLPFIIDVYSSQLVYFVVVVVFFRLIQLLLLLILRYSVVACDYTVCIKWNNLWLSTKMKHSHRRRDRLEERSFRSGSRGTHNEK